MVFLWFNPVFFYGKEWPRVQANSFTITCQRHGRLNRRSFQRVREILVRAGGTDKGLTSIASHVVHAWGVMWGQLGGVRRFAGCLGIPFRRETEEWLKFNKEEKAPVTEWQHSQKLFLLTNFELTSVSLLRDSVASSHFYGRKTSSEKGQSWR